MDLEALLARHGGVVTRSQLLAQISRQELGALLASGDLVLISRGRYARPIDDAVRRAAVELSGTVILLSAAQHWGWPVQWVASRPQVAVPRGRTVSVDVRKTVDVRWRTIPKTDIVDGWVTSRVRTVVDCAVLLPWPEALAVADSALRSKKVGVGQLWPKVADLPRQHRGRVSRVLDAATDQSANPFESVLRAICLDVPGLRVRPQVTIEDRDGWVGRVDLADVALQIVIEADGHELHTERHQFDRDCARGSRLTADGWLVLRFTWTQVMRRPDWVRGILARVVAQRRAAAA